MQSIRDRSELTFHTTITLHNSLLAVVKSQSIPNLYVLNGFTWPSPAAILQLVGREQGRGGPGGRNCGRPQGRDEGSKNPESGHAEAQAEECVGGRAAASGVSGQRVERAYHGDLPKGGRGRQGVRVLLGEALGSLLFTSTTSRRSLTQPTCRRGLTSLARARPRQAWRNLVALRPWFYLCLLTTMATGCRSSK